MKTKEIATIGASTFLAGAMMIMACAMTFAQKPNHPLNGTQDTKPIPQTPESQNPSAQTPAADTASEQILQGCISSKDGRYFLRGGDGESVILAGNQNFGLHLGHNVAVRGTFTNSNTEASKPMDSVSGKAGEPVHEFTVTRLEIVAENCSSDQSVLAAPKK
jgi:hypothetical protein